jgi:hypothetical protein
MAKLIERIKLEDRISNIIRVKPMPEEAISNWLAFMYKAEEATFTKKKRGSNVE